MDVACDACDCIRRVVLAEIQYISLSFYGKQKLSPKQGACYQICTFMDSVIKLGRHATTASILLNTRLRSQS